VVPGLEVTSRGNAILLTSRTASHSAGAMMMMIKMMMLAVT
jgi:hypothetical protein